MSHTAEMTISNVIFENSTQDRDGAGLYVMYSSKYSTVTISGSRFANCTATGYYGGGFAVLYSTEVIVSTSNITISTQLDG